MEQQMSPSPRLDQETRSSGSDSVPLSRPPRAGNAGLAALLFAATIAAVACGGSEAPGPATPPSPPPGTPGSPTPPPATPTAASLELVVSKAAMAANASDKIDVSVRALDSSRISIKGVPVALAADSGVLAAPSGSVTGTGGDVTSTFTLGQDRANRTVTITATSGTLTTSAQIVISGSTVQLTASKNVVANATEPVTLAVVLRDAAGQPLSNAQVSFSTTQGTLAATTAVANAEGRASTTLTGVVSAATVTATALGTSANATVNSDNQVLPPVQPTNIQIRSLLLQANPTVIGPNTTPNGRNSVDLQLTVLGDLPAAGTQPAAFNVPVTNARARFRILNNPPRGALSVDTTTNPVLSNAAGQANVAFIPGAATSATNGVIVCAKVDGFTPAGGGGLFGCAADEVSARLTIGLDALFVRISTNNEIEKVDNNLNYIKRFSIVVTDAVGRGVPGVQVTPTLEPLYYYKGPWLYNGTSWVRGVLGVVNNVPTILPATRECANEDTNNNGVIDVVPAKEDVNRDNRLWPGQVAATAMDNNGVTDSTGFVILQVKYGQIYAYNATYRIKVSGKVGGSEGVTTYDYFLSALVNDVTSENTPGAFVQAPFGKVVDAVTLSAPRTMANGETLPAGTVLEACANPD
jgi:hypothetical protein